MFRGKKKLKIITLVFAVFMLIFICLQAPWQYYFEGKPLTLEVTARVQNDDTWQLFYTAQAGERYREENSIKANVVKSDSFQAVKFRLYKRDILSFRLDTGTQPAKVAIKELRVKGFKSRYTWDIGNIKKDFELSKDIISTELVDNSLYLNIAGNDPFLNSGDVHTIFDSVKNNDRPFFYLITCLLIILICGAYIFALVYKRFAAFLLDIVNSRTLIIELAKKDLQKRYLGSYLGILWAFVQPTVTILIFWFVFQVGFKSKPINDFPFVLWLICGMIPWFFFSEALQSSTNSILENSYLVKKIVFRVSSLPIIRILSSLFIHVFFILLIFVMFLVYGYKPSIYNIQVIYYLFASIALLLGLSWITSSLVVFLRDLGHIVSILIQFGFWLTPIFWSFSIMPPKYQFLFKLNPVYYIVEGYRDTFINHIWFWQHYNLTISFWLITLGFLFIGVLLFKKLRPHFADVL